MSNAPSLVGYLQTEAIQTRQPDSESLWSTTAGSVNSSLDRQIEEHIFKANGAYSLFSGKLAVDQIWVVPYNLTIIDAVISHGIAGITGTTEIDIKYATTPGGTWTSIFTVTPKIGTTASNYAWCGIGQTVTGFTAGTLSASPFLITQGWALRMDVITTMSGGNRDVALKLKLRGR